jgi:hypothetical protein
MKDWQDIMTVRFGFKGSAPYALKSVILLPGYHETVSCF